jgi:hypothetical protein
MLLSVLIPCRNAAAQLPQLMQELALLPTLLFPEHFPELLIVDGGSDDGSVPLAVAWCERSAVPARVVALDAPHPLAQVLLEGATLVAGDAVLLLDPATTCTADELVGLVRGLEHGVELVLPSCKPMGATPRPSVLERGIRPLLPARRSHLSAQTHLIMGPRLWRRETFLACLPKPNARWPRASMLAAALARDAGVRTVPLAWTDCASPLAASRLEALGLLAGVRGR